MDNPIRAAFKIIGASLGIMVLASCTQVGFEARKSEVLGKSSVFGDTVQIPVTQNGERVGSIRIPVDQNGNPITPVQIPVDGGGTGGGSGGGNGSGNPNDSTEIPVDQPHQRPRIVRIPIESGRDGDDRDCGKCDCRDGRDNTRVRIADAPRFPNGQVSRPIDLL
jgi:hypothetical protein